MFSNFNTNPNLYLNPYLNSEAGAIFRMTTI